MNWFAYRIPGNEDVRGKSDHVERGMTADGFYVLPFGASEGFTIPSAKADNHSKGYCPSSCELPCNSTTRAEHAAGVNRIIEEIRCGNLRKCVLARVELTNGNFDADKLFENLCSHYPSAFVFAYHTPQTGTWIGASPELLLRKKGNTLATVALAGTRTAASKGEWDSKNIEEQRIVTEYIKGVLESCGCDVGTGKPETHAAGPVEHIMTAIRATAPEDTCLDAEELVTRLSPTPALCGYPRNESHTLIGRCENFRRGHYGGCCGPVEAGGENMDLYVNLRSLCMKDGIACLFAGGGIMADSEAQKEWEETEHKLETLKRIIETSNQQ